MHNLSLIRSIFLFVTAATIIYFFIYPQVAQIRNNQDQKALFDNEFSRVATVNQILSQYQSTIASIPITERQRLSRLLPSEIDELLLLRDVEALLSLFGVAPTNISFKNDSSQNQQRSEVETGDDRGQSLIMTRAIDIVFETSYENAKNIFLFTEQHPYVLSFEDIAISPNENNSNVRIEATIITYVYQSQSSVTDNINI